MLSYLSFTVCWDEIVLFTVNIFKLWKMTFVVAFCKMLLYFYCHEVLLKFSASQVDCPLKLYSKNLSRYLEFPNLETIWFCNMLKFGNFSWLIIFWIKTTIIQWDSQNSSPTLWVAASHLKHNRSIFILHKQQ